LTFIADDQDQNTHVNQSEYQNRGIDSLYCEYNIEKIYLDAFVQDSVNNTYPGADTAIISRADSGALLIDYIGQGSYNSWAEELSIDSSTFSNFNNGAKLPFYYSATANFNQLDNPAFVSGGERLVLNPNGGGIASLSASRLSYSGSNFSLSVKFFNNLFLPVNGEMPRIGDIWKQTCRDYMDQYTYNFILLGDPALRLAYPVNRVVTTTINGNPVSSNADTLLAGSSVTIDGEIQDASSVLLSGFNGTLNVIVFNHAVTLHTLGNDQYWTGNGGNDWPIPFRAWVDTLYAGTVSVVNGMFSFSFIMPMNIDSTYAFGKISYYAQNGSTDAGGCYNNVVVGGGNLSGIEEANPAISVGVFPNPAKDECHFRVKGYSHSSFSFSLFDISGRRVMEQKETSMDFDVNLSGIGSGMYLYQLESADKKVNSHGKLFVDR
jgi:hypothetical protein